MTKSEKLKVALMKVGKKKPLTLEEASMEIPGTGKWTVAHLATMFGQDVPEEFDLATEREDGTSVRSMQKIEEKPSATVLRVEQQIRFEKSMYKMKKGKSLTAEEWKRRSVRYPGYSVAHFAEYLGKSAPESLFHLKAANGVTVEDLYAGVIICDGTMDPDPE